MKRTVLKTGEKSLARGSTFQAPPRPLERRSELGRGQAAPEHPSQRKPCKGVRKGISPASPAQRVKAKAADVCRACGGPRTAAVPLHPAHIVDRSLGGCDDQLCVWEGCPSCHRLYDDGDLDLLPVISKEEQAHAVLHVGLIGALRRITNDRRAAE